MLKLAKMRHVLRPLFVRQSVGVMSMLRALGAVGRLTSTLSARPQPSSVASNIFRRLSSTLAEAAPPQPSNDAQRIARWTVRLSHDNTFLSYHRNAIIATVAGCALVQYRKGEGRPPLAMAHFQYSGTRSTIAYRN